MDSLVVVKDLGKKEELSQGEIISFYVGRLGDKIVFTHYFEKKEIDETGKERYYTKAENADRYDDYVTYREDILGTYVYHIPYAGKVVRFLQSPFALLEFGLICIFLIIYHILWNKFDREEKAMQEAQAAQAYVIPKETVLKESVPLIGESKNTEGISKVSGQEAESVQICTTPLKELPPKKTEEVQERPYIVNDVLFGYRTVPSSGAFENGGAGYTLTVGRNGVLRLEVHKEKKGSEEIAVVTLRNRSLKKIMRIMKDSALVIQNLPETLDNGYSVGAGSFFIFRGREVAAWNIKRKSKKCFERGRH